MDAVEFLKEINRMCGENGPCRDCPLALAGPCAISKLARWDPNWVVQTVEKWSKEHPRKTRLQDFLEKYPNAPLIHDGMKLPKACAQNLGYCESCPVGTNCYSCWNEPLED